MRNQLTLFITHASVLALLGACATAGDPPNNNADASNLCGNGNIDPGEACDGQNLNGATCETQGYYPGGTLSCNPATCTLNTNACYRCGDGQINDTGAGPEECDGQNLNGATCETQGYDGGNLACDPQYCTLDTSGCNASQTLRNDDGDCSQYLGCGGNPQKLVECFSNATLEPPFRLTQVTYSIDANLGPADALNLDVYQWNGSGPPGTGIVSVPLQAADLTPGEHTVTLGIAVDLDSTNFCVGVTALTPTNVGFALSRSPTVSVAGSSWIQAAPCNLANFATNDAVGFPGNYCIGATISKSN